MSNYLRLPPGNQGRRRLSSYPFASRVCLHVHFFLVQPSIINHESSIQRAASDLGVPLPLDGCSRLCRKIPCWRGLRTGVSHADRRNKENLCARAFLLFKWRTFGSIPTIVQGISTAEFGGRTWWRKRKGHSDLLPPGARLSTDNPPG
jgi:hypothetical protein